MEHKKKFYLFILILNLAQLKIFFCSELAVIKVPVADLIGAPIHALTTRNILNFFDNISVKEHSPRLHQALFNEIITVLEYEGALVHILLENIFFESNGKKHTDYWTMTKNILPLKKIIAPEDINKIPPAISFKSLDRYSEGNIVILKRPWYDIKTDQTYSVGTRFVLDSKKLQDDQNYYVFLLHAPTKTIMTSVIPKYLCILEEKLTQKEKINLFVDILKNWARSTEIIPYVWGGSSFIKDHPKTGFDCSGLVARTAQIALIPFFYKNTSTIASYLEPIKISNKVSDGDIIWIPGHVMIISDVAKNMLIEAGSYAYGYGFVHEIPLQRQFKNIKNYDDLKNAFIRKKPLIRFHANGHEKQKIKEFKILKLTSAWQALDTSSRINQKSDKQEKVVKKRDNFQAKLLPN